VGQHAGIKNTGKTFSGRVNMQESWVNMNRNGGSTCSGIYNDMNNINEKHSQPHWHITSSQAIEKTFEEYSNNFDNGDFISLLEKEKEKLVDVKKIHFAMNGNWQNNQPHIHKISDSQQVAKWLKGLLSHIRLELEE
jgi:hypothetical protein